MPRRQNGGQSWGSAAAVHDPVGQTLRIQLLGTFQVSVGRDPLPRDAWRLRKAAALVKILAISRDHRLHRDEVLDLLWPDLDPSAAANNLHYALHTARRRLPAGFLVFVGELLSLGPAGDFWVDVREFEDLAVHARECRDIGAYRDALALYSGDLLPEDLYEEWSIERRSALRSLRLSLLLELGEQYEWEGRCEDACETLLSAVEIEPTLERAHVGLMRLLAKLGQRAEALRRYDQMRKVLWDELGIEPDDEAEELRRDILAGKVTSVNRGAPAPSRPHNLPAPLTSFVGRQSEMTDLQRLLEANRMVTLLGPGGAGKTRLSLEVAHATLPQYSDGVVLIELASLRDPYLVSRAVAHELQISEEPGRSMEETIIGVLATRHMLILLDNCEHLLDACAQLTTTLLLACPHIRILATSREPLGVGGEVTMPIPPLGCPDLESETSFSGLESYDAVRLLVARIQQRRPSFALSAENASAVAAICRQVDGLPLAIELAAARAGALSVKQIVERLTDPLDFLTTGLRTVSPRQQTLRGALDWSYDLLDDEDRAFFLSLAVFPGSFTLETVHAIHKGKDVLDKLTRLVDKSLVVQETEAEDRYRLLEPIRQYAEARRSCEAPSDDAMERRHAMAFLSLAERADTDLRGPDQVAWLERLEREHHNLRAALTWLLSHDAGMALRLAARLWYFWYLRGYLEEGRRRLSAALAVAPDEPTLDRAAVLRGLGVLASAQGEYAAAVEYLEEALDISRVHGETREIALCLNSLGIIACEQGHADHAIVLHEEALALRRQLGNETDIAASLLNMGFAVHTKGDWETSWTLHEEALAVGRALGNTALVALALHNLGCIAVMRKDYPRCVPFLVESLTLSHEVGETRRVAACLECLATSALGLGHLDVAARLAGCAVTLRRVIAAPLYPSEMEEWEETVAGIRAAMDQHQFSTEWSRGEALTVEEAIEDTVVLQQAEGAGSGVPSALDCLTPREREIALLLSEGLTNRQIALLLDVSERTADTHVGRILRKLGVTSRAQVAPLVFGSKPSVPMSSRG